MQSCDFSDLQKVSYSKFCSLWTDLCPWIVVAKPLTDLCGQCQQGNNMLRYNKAENEEERNDQRSELLTNQLNHNIR